MIIRAVSSCEGSGRGNDVLETSHPLLEKEREEKREDGDGMRGNDVLLSTIPAIPCLRDDTAEKPNEALLQQRSQRKIRRLRPRTVS